MAGFVLVKYIGDALGIRKASSEAEAAVGGVEKAAVGAAGKTGLFSKELGGLASTATGQVAPGLAGMAGHLSKIANGSGGAALAAAGLGVAIGEMALHGVADYLKLADEVRGVQRVTGATAEESSKLNAVMKMSGVEATTGARAFFQLSKTIDQHASKLTDDGIAIAKNKDGSVNLIKTTENVAAAYQKAGKGAEGNAIANDAFGKSGQALLPILGKTKEALDGIIESAGKHHEIMSQEDLDKALDLKIAMKELGEATDGLERELGQKLVPALTDVVERMTVGIEKIDEWSNATWNFVQAGDGAGEATHKWSDALLHFLDPITAAAEKTSKVTQATAEYKKGLDAGFKSILSTTDAFIDNGKALDDLASATKEGQKKDESAIAYKDRLTKSLDNVIQTIPRVVDGLVAQGKVSDTAAGRTTALVTRLQELKAEYPQLGTEINQFIIIALEAAAKSGAAGYQIAANFAAGMQRGLVDGESRVVGSADSIGRHIENTLNGTLNIPSPSAPSGVGERAGSSVGTGISKGLDDSKPEVQKSADEIAAVLNGLAADITTTFDTINHLGDSKKTLDEAKAEEKRIYEEMGALPGRIQNTKDQIAKLDDLINKPIKGDPEAEGRRLANRDRNIALRDRERQHLSDLIHQQRDDPAALAAATRARENAEGGAVNAQLAASSATVNLYALQAWLDAAMATLGTPEAVRILNLILDEVKNPPNVTITLDGHVIAKSVRKNLNETSKSNGGVIL